MIKKLSTILPVVLVVALLVAFPGSVRVSAQQTTFKIWHYEQAAAATTLAWDAAMKQFQAKHPDVKLEYENKNFEQLQTTASMVLNSDQAPDVMELNKGNGNAGLVAKQGLLTDLTDVAKQKGWDKILPPSVLTTCLYDTNGTMGSGKLYGVTDYGEYVMVFYNKDMFKTAGITALPTSLDEFTAIMDKFVKAGTTPLTTSGAEYPATQIFYELALYKADRQFVNDYQLLQHPVDFKGPALTYAANTLADWVTKGYISKTDISQKAQDMETAFVAGKNPMMISGSWWFGTLMSDIKTFDWGMFLMPGKKLNTGSGGNLWVVPVGAQNKDLAYEFIDITLSKENQTLLGNGGSIPVNADLTQIKDPKLQELIQNFATIVKNDGLAFYPDWPVAGFYNTICASMQDIMSGKPTSDVLDALGKFYNDNKPQ